MARTARKRSKTGIYHVMVRGEGRHMLFEDGDDNEDRRVFLRLLSNALEKHGVVAYAWCLMSNHAHMVLRADFDRLPLVMKSLSSGYATYYNKKYDHVGHVFGGRYNSKPVETDEYLLQVVRYIHLNPVEDGLSMTCRYRWSSYSDYLDGTGFVQTELVLDVCGGLEQFESYHEEYAAEKLGRPSMPRTRLSDTEALSIAREAIGADYLAKLGSRTRLDRNEGIAILRRAGLSTRQIERFTGIGRGIISRVKWK